jgi:hypothetical protein
MLIETLTAALGLGGLLTLAAFTAPNRRIETVIDIPAPPQAVWQVLADGPAYGRWNPFIRAMSGKVAAGERLTNTMHPQGGKPMTFRPTVLVADPGRELRWLGRLGLPRFFDGEHYFRLEATDTGTRLVHGETFRGLLLWVMSTDRFRADFTAMNLALRDRVLSLRRERAPEEKE